MRVAVIIFRDAPEPVEESAETIRVRAELRRMEEERASWPEDKRRLFDAIREHRAEVKRGRDLKNILAR